MSPVGPKIRRRLLMLPSGLKRVLRTKLLRRTSTVTMSGAWSTTWWTRPARRWLFPARELSSRIMITAQMATCCYWQMKTRRKCKFSPQKSTSPYYLYSSFRVCGNKKMFKFKSASDFMVEFISDGKKKGRGAKGCKVTCSKSATETTTTAAPTTTGGK